MVIHSLSITFVCRRRCFEASCISDADAEINIGQSGCKNTHLSLDREL